MILVHGETIISFCPFLVLEKRGLDLFLKYFKNITVLKLHYLLYPNTLKNLILQCLLKLKYYLNTSKKTLVPMGLKHLLIWNRGSIRHFSFLMAHICLVTFQCVSLLILLRTYTLFIL
jgi:hypothetical protein